ncbi:MAG: M67 family metallopeptidase [Methylococcales bacterium]|nr:M67 family metallopeptidase [Methylococcales bacterium]
MNAAEIHIPRKLTNQLLHLAQLSPDFEVCGLVSSHNGVPSRCYPVANCAEHPEQRFLLDAKQQIAAMADMRERGEQLFAIYHSHPSAPAQPSSHDVELAAYPEALYLIISLNTKGILEMRGFKIKQQAAVEIPLVMND